MKPTWLVDGAGPRMVDEAMKLYGIHEGIGDADNKTILGWATEIGVKGYIHDSIPWCGLFMGLVAKRANFKPPAQPLWALNWSAWGKKVKAPCLGDVLTFTRNGGGHVCLYVGEDNTAYYCLGGNEGDEVQVERILKVRLHSANRPPYGKVPANVKPIKITTNMAGILLSTNEA